MPTKLSPNNWLRQALVGARTPEKLGLADWADRYRVLSSEAAAEPGRWSTSRAEYQRGIMDAWTDKTVEVVVVKSSAQVGKSEIILNALGWIIDVDPGPAMLVQPNLDAARTFSTDRVGPMVRDSRRLTPKVSDPKAKSGEATVLHRNFVGGHYTLIGANAPAGLAGRPIRYLFCDEIDRYPPSAGVEGNPVKLAWRRTATFRNRKILLTSTPTVKGASLIDQYYEQGDQRVYRLPCPYCGSFVALAWSGIKFDRDRERKLVPGSVRFECPDCKAAWSEADKLRQLPLGRWDATATPANPKVRSFHLNELYSPWSTWEGVVAHFLEAKETVESLRVFVNTVLGESWEDGDAMAIPEDSLMARVEEYEGVPRGAYLLTAGVDVQDTYLVATVYGWGLGEESFVVDHRVILGSPGSAATWAALDDYLDQSFVHEQGGALGIAATCIDSGGHFTDEVYAYCKQREGRRRYAIKGMAGPGNPVVGKFSLRGRIRVKLFQVGVDTAKEILYGRLQNPDPGRGYIHFRRDVCDADFFRQLTAEKQVKKFDKGYVKLVWVKTRPRNEALDTAVYALAAYRILNPNMDRIAKRYLAAHLAQDEGVEPGLEDGAEPVQDVPTTPEPVQKPPEKVQETPRKPAPRRPARPKKGWVNGWK